MRYAVFETATGRIDRIIVAPTGVASATASCRAGEDFVAANTRETDATHYVERFTLVAFPARPSPFHDWNWTSRTWEVNSARAWAEVRRRRNRMLAACDWTQLPDAPLTALQKTAWTAYRTRLRDVTERVNPLAITWPQEPAA